MDIKLMKANLYLMKAYKCLTDGESTFGGIQASYDRLTRPTKF